MDDRVGIIRKEMQADPILLDEDPMTALTPLLKVKDQIIDVLDKSIYNTAEKRYNRALEML